MAQAVVPWAVGIAALLALAACSGGSGDGTAVGADPAPVAPTPAPAPSSDSTPNPTPTPNPTVEPAPSPAPAANGAPPALPTVDASGIVRWAARNLPADADLTLLIEPFATVPRAPDGSTERLNVMAHVSGQLFVGAERSGRIYRVAAGQPTVLWFDVAAALEAQGVRLNAATSTAHSGLRSIAFHPDFARNGRFYLSAMLDRPAVTAGRRYLSDVADPIEADSVVMEWTADPASMQVVPGSYRELFRVGMSVYDHTIKQIAFGPDGRLYIAHGDGTDQGAAAGGGLRLDDALGKLLRIDPLPSGGQPYTVPPDNPFAGVAGALPETWSYGHRNPHHLAFLPDGTLVVAEPGHSNLDEINLIERGGNHGWSLREGTYVHRPSGGLLDGLALLPPDDAAGGFVYPAIQFGHTDVRGAPSSRLALGGGYVVNNGSALSGRYFYCEFASSGDLFFATVAELQSTVRKGPPDRLTQAPMQRARIVFDHDGVPATEPQARTSMVDVVDDSPDYNGSGRADIRFGQGPDGTLYLMSKNNGTIYRIGNSRP